MVNVYKHKLAAKNIIIIFLTALIISISIVAYSYKEKSETLKDKYSDLEVQSIEIMKQLNSTIKNLKKENSQLRLNLSKLNQSYNTLEERYISLNETYHELGDEHVSQQKELDEAFSKIRTYRHELNNSMKWFRANSVIKKTDFRPLARELEKRCLKDCKIKLGCIYLVNDQEGYEYKSDELTKNATDKLQSLEEFKQNKGGDCEDYGLFFKAELNYLMSKCENPKLETFREGSGKYYLDKEKEWHINNVEGMKLDATKPVVVCGSMLEPDTEYGHCVLAFTEKEIENTDDFKALDEAVMVEPQDGSFYGELQSESLGPGIQVIITDNDLFLYSTIENEWLSYGIFESRLSELEA